MQHFEHRKPPDVPAAGFQPTAEVAAPAQGREEDVLSPPVASAGPQITSDPVMERARAYVRAAKAPSTLRAYRSDWADFERWCEEGGYCALPATPETVALYLAARAEDKRPATLRRRLTAISKSHAAAGYPTPATLTHLPVQEVLQGIRRTHGIAQVGKAPLLTADLQAVVAHCGVSLAGLRDRALLLLGYAGAFRRSELAALAVGDLTEDGQNLVVLLRRSKTDPGGAGRKVAIVRGRHLGTCPVRTVAAWREAAGITEGTLFRAVSRHGKVQGRGLHPNANGEIVKRAVVRAGYPPETYAGHSLRAGFATQAARNGASAFEIMRQTGHRSIEIVSRYVREAELFQDAAAGKLGL